jgi:hypothetical protein
MAASGKTSARSRTAVRSADVTKALDSLTDAIARAQTAAKAVRSDLGRSPLRATLARDVERLVRDLRRDAGKLDRAVRKDLRQAVTTKPAAKKPAAKKPAAKKKAVAKKKTAKKTTARRTARA